MAIEEAADIFFLREKSYKIQLVADSAAKCLLMAKLPSSPMRTRVIRYTSLLSQVFYLLG